MTWPPITVQNRNYFEHIKWAEFISLLISLRKTCRRVGTDEWNENELWKRNKWMNEPFNKKIINSFFFKQKSIILFKNKKKL